MNLSLSMMKEDESKPFTRDLKINIEVLVSWIYLNLLHFLYYYFLNGFEMGE